MRCGARIGIVATVATTLDPTERLILRKAHECGKRVATGRYLVDGAFDALMSGRADSHDAMVRTEIERAARESDVVVLAQGSMARLVPQLSVRAPVLASPRLGVEALRAVLRGQAQE